MSRIAWVHGYTMDSSVWKPLWDRMSEHEHVGIDLPLHGSAAHVPMPATLAQVADSVAERMRAVGADVLVGLSFGSAVALQTAMDHPDVVRSLVLAAPTFAGQPDDPAARAKYFLLIRQFMQAGAGERLADIWMSDPPHIFTGLRRHPERFAAVREVIARHSFAELATGAMQGINATTHTPADLSRISAKVLVISGTEDMPQFRANAAALREHVDNATLVEEPGLGHLPLLENPEGSAQVLESFLGRSSVVPERLATAAR